MKACPRCNTKCVNSAVNCECGHFFQDDTPEGVPVPASAPAAAPVNSEETDRAVFRERAISTFQNFKYFFEQDFDRGRPIQRISTGLKLLAAGGALVAGGLISALGTKPSKFSDDEVKAEVIKLRRTCDLVGIRLDTGGVLLALFIYADSLSDEQMIGRSILILDQMKSFREFTMKFGWSKMAVSARVFYVFRDSGKAFHFRQCVQAHCKHGEFFKKIYVRPWGIDLSARSVWAHTGLPDLGLKPADIEARLFS
jgi:hypothetical protein